MRLEDITDPDSVRLAAAEFDRIGSEAFLQKYQFGKSRSYFLALNSNLSDSKAIIGAAHGYQFPDIGAAGWARDSVQFRRYLTGFHASTIVEIQKETLTCLTGWL